MRMRLDTLANVIDIATKFNENFTHSWEVHRKKEMIIPPTKFKKILFVFKGPRNLSINHLEI